MVNKMESESDIVYEKNLESGHVIQVRWGDITREKSDSIVNAANRWLQHGGGVAGAIRMAGGSAVCRESDDWVEKYGEVPTGRCGITGPGNLPCKKIIHAVGPVWGGNRNFTDDRLLASAVFQSLNAAAEMKHGSISIPAISSGIFGFPKNRCAVVMLAAALEYCQRFPNSPVKEIRFTNYDRATVNIFENEVHQRFEGKESSEQVIKARNLIKGQVNGWADNWLEELETLNPLTPNKVLLNSKDDESDDEEMAEEKEEMAEEKKEEMAEEKKEEMAEEKNEEMAEEKNEEIV